jgi:hypothetical protein
LTMTFSRAVRAIAHSDRADREQLGFGRNRKAALDFMPILTGTGVPYRLDWLKKR